MTLNLTNPITEKLVPEMLSAEGNDCYISRTGYEVDVNGEKYALYPLFSEATAKIGEEVTVSSMGRLNRGQVTKVLTGYQDAYTEQSLIGENNSSYIVLERSYSLGNVTDEHTFEIDKSI